jgi:hypothetical protein
VFQVIVEEVIKEVERLVYVDRAKEEPTVQTR